jgi:hypothetical protein
MKGVIFNVVEEVLAETLPTGAWDAALVSTGLDGAYTSLGDYPDAEMRAILAAVSARSGMEEGTILRHAGRYGYRLLAERHADLVAPFATFGDLVRHLDDVIHPEVLKLYPHAHPPQFEFPDAGADAGASGPDEERWVLVYRSDRGLCDLAIGLLQGAAASFGLHAEVAQTACVHRGDGECRLEVSVDGAGSGAVHGAEGTPR